MRAKIFILSLLFAVLCFYSLAFSDVPQMINYQGKLTTPERNLITDTVSILFTIYDDSIGVDSLWTETQDSVVVRNGIFSVLLGSTNEIPDSVFDGNVRYLGVKVGDDSEMTPRRAIVSVGYAFRSEIADTALYAIEAVSAESDSDWIFSGNDMYSAVSGNVGIGTMGPTEKLDVNGNIRIRIGNRLKLFNTDDTDYGTIHGVQSGGVAGISFNTDTFVNALYIKNDGNVGIGTTNPQGKLDINGSLAVAGDEGSAGQVLTSQGPETNPVWGDVIPNGSVSQAKLKTVTGEVSGGHGGNWTPVILPGGEYGFYPQLKGVGNYIRATILASSWVNTTTYTTYIELWNSAAQLTYAQQRYVTASGKDHWMFLLIDKDAKQVLAGYQAPDHPCYGSGGDENDIPHPFGSYDPEKHEVILVANNILPELKSKVTSKRSLLTIINEEYEINFDSEPVYEPREIIEIDEYGDKGGDILQKIKTPEWAKILIGKDEIYLKRRLVETLPDYISYKKLKPKSEIIVESQILTQSSGVELDATSHR